MQRSRRQTGRLRGGLLVAAVLASVTGSVHAGPTVPVEVPFTPITTVYSQDFEEGTGGYTTGGTTSFAYGEAVSPPTIAVGQGPKMWGTNLTGDYGNLECGYLQSAPIDLSQAPGGASLDPASVARLAFRHWLHTENRFDVGVVLASANGTDWSVIDPIGGYTALPFTTARTCLGLSATQLAYTTATAPAADAWSVARFDVTPFLGGNLHLRWAFASDSTVVRRGWYIDDVAVQLGFGAATAVTVPDPPTQVDVPFTMAAPHYVQDFEESGGGWTGAGTGAWEWGAPADPPSPPTGSSTMWGTRLLGNFLPNECATLTSPAIELPATAVSGAELARAQFKLFRDMESSFDGGSLQISDGGAFTTIAASGYNGTVSVAAVRTCLGVVSGQSAWTGSSEDWIQNTVNLTPYLGKKVQFRFVFASDGDTERRGLYVDDFAIELGAGGRITTETSTRCDGFPGWTAGGINSTWCYGVPSSGPGGPLPAYATNLAGNYKPSECSAIVSPAVPTNAVPGLGTLTLTFSHFMKTASSDDGGVVQISKDDGATWTTVTPVGGYNTNSLGTSARGCVAPGATTAPGFSGTVTASGYQTREVKIGQFAEQTIRVRFLFGSGTSSEDVGWYVRAVGLNRGAGSVPLLP